MKKAIDGRHFISSGCWPRIASCRRTRVEQDDALRDHEPAKGGELGPPGDLLADDDLCAILAPDLLGGRKEERDRETKAHDDDENDVGGRAAGRRGVSVKCA